MAIHEVIHKAAYIINCTILKAEIENIEMDKFIMFLDQWNQHNQSDTITKSNHTDSMPSQ